jgi:stress-induced morphogen
MTALNILKHFSIYSNLKVSSNSRLSILPSLANQLFVGTRTFKSSSLLTSSNDGDTDSKKVPSQAEQKLIDMLKKRFPDAKIVDVNDISGGCGSMYEVYVETNEFKNIKKVKQHQIINQVLESEIKNNMHGLRIYTGIPEKD